MPKIITSAIGAITGSTAQGKAAKQAAATEAQAARDANGLLAPYAASGDAANNELQFLLGLNPNSEVAGSNLGAAGSLARPFDNNDFVKDPGYDFRMQQGQQALERSAAARGGSLSGAALKAITKYGQDYASNEFGNAYNRYNQNQQNLYSRLSGQQDLGLRTSGAEGSNLEGGASATAAGQVAGANAYAKAFSNLLNTGVAVATGNPYAAAGSYLSNNAVTPANQTGLGYSAPYNNSAGTASGLDPMSYGSGFNWGLKY